MRILGVFRTVGLVLGMFAASAGGDEQAPQSPGRVVLDKQLTIPKYVGPPLTIPTYTGPAPRAFKLTNEAIRLAKGTAAAELAKRGDLKGRRPPGLGDLDTPEEIQSAVDAAMSDLASGDPDVVSNGRARIEYLGPAAFESLTEHLASDQNAQRRAMCAQMMVFHTRHAAGPLIQAFKTDRATAVRAEAAHALGQTFDPVTVPALIEALDDADMLVRVAAVRALEYCRDERAIEPLSRVQLGGGTQHLVGATLKMIRTPKTEGIQYWPPELLGLLQLAKNAHTLAGERFGPGSIDELLSHVDSDNPWIASDCILALQSLDVRRAVPKIIRCKSSSSKFSALAKMATPEAVDYLIDCLQSHDKLVRIGAVDGLGCAGRWAVPPLVDLLDDPSLIIEGAHVQVIFDGADAGARPDQHRALNAMMMCLAEAGHRPRSVNLAAQQKPDELDAEIGRVKAWWKKNGPDFLRGADVPNPKLQSVFWDS
jgi:HEAT repeat protein